MRGILVAERAHQIKIARKLLKNSNLAMHVGSVAIAIEALESILIDKGVLKTDELMDRIKQVSSEHYAKGQMLPEMED
jgi:hypothetical protein